MRHIQTKLIGIIVTILISISSYGQMQQCLKNGFVAATDSGVYYLQDGFNEWVFLGIPNKESINSTDEVLDSVSGIMEYGCSVFSYSSDVSESGGKQQYHNDLYFYGAKLFEYSGAGNSFIDYIFTPKNILAYKTFGEGYIYWHPCSVASRSYIGINLSKNTGDWYTFISSWIAYSSSMAVDNDSSVCVVGKYNIFHKLIASELEVNNADITISGLHSRTTDSHQICYNPDDDIFIIVSDSGIVYSYDKTTLTTLDTVYFYGFTYNEINDLVYNSNDQYYYIIMKRVTPDTNYSILMTNDFISYKNISLESNYSPVLAVGNPYTLAVDSGRNVLITTPSTESYDIYPEIINRTVFDLDYIDYNP